MGGILAGILRAAGQRNFWIYLLVILVSSSIFAQANEKPRPGVNLSGAEKKLMAEVSEATALAEKLRKIADTVDDDIWLGTMYNEIHLKEHSCYALGVLLGQEETVRHLKLNSFPRQQATNSDEARTLRLNAQSLCNFGSAATHALSISHEERVMEWNLDCVGQLGISGAYVTATKTTTFYRLHNDGKVLRILGSIEPGFSAELRNVIAINPQVKTVSLGGGGGSVYEAIEAGRFIRMSGLDTTLWNNCYSACPLVFAGGKERTIWSPYPSLGFHKVYSKNGPVPLSSQVYRDIFAYLVEMGITPNFILENMFKAEPNQIRAERYKILT
jgi:hypothetical protein